MATTKDPEPLEALQSLGFSEIEAKVYTYLLQNEPSTGYRISHAIGKPTANTYKSIAGLERLGAVQVEDGENRLVRAVPPKELLSQLERGFRRKKKEAEATLKRLGRHAADDRLYSLRSVEQVLERAGTMIRRASTIILADLFPGPFQELEGELRRAAARKVRVALKLYGPSRGAALPPGVLAVRVDPADEIFAAWPGEQITLVADAEEHLLALLSRPMNEVHQAIWSRSTFLSCMHHNHVAMEIVETAGLSGGGAARTPELSSITLLRSGAPGLKRLQSRFGRGAADGNPPTTESNP